MERRAKRKNKEDPVTATKAKKPKGRAHDCLVTDQSALNVNLMAQALSPKTLQRAWEQVKANHGAPGVDGMTVEQFPDFVRSPQWAAVKQWGLNDAWLKSQPSRRRDGPPPGGSDRRERQLLVSIRELWIAFHYPASNQSGLPAR
jgi:RNA-directed DNA polymerase